MFIVVKYLYIQLSFAIHWAAQFFPQTCQKIISKHVLFQLSLVIVLPRIFSSSSSLPDSLCSILFAQFTDLAIVENRRVKCHYNMILSSNQHMNSPDRGVRNPSCLPKAWHLQKYLRIKSGIPSSYFRFLAHIGGYWALTSRLLASLTSKSE